MASTYRTIQAQRGLRWRRQLDRVLDAREAERRRVRAREIERIELADERLDELSADSNVAQQRWHDGRREALHDGELQPRSHEAHRTIARHEVEAEQRTWAALLALVAQSSRRELQRHVEELDQRVEEHDLVLLLGEAKALVARRVSRQ